MVLARVACCICRLPKILDGTDGKWGNDGWYCSNCTDDFWEGQDDPSLIRCLDCGVPVKPDTTNWDGHTPLPTKLLCDSCSEAYTDEMEDEALRKLDKMRKGLNGD